MAGGQVAVPPECFGDKEEKYPAWAGGGEERAWAVTVFKGRYAHKGEQCVPVVGTEGSKSQNRESSQRAA